MRTKVLTTNLKSENAIAYIREQIPEAYNPTPIYARDAVAKSGLMWMLEQLAKNPVSTLESINSNVDSAN